MELKISVSRKGRSFIANCQELDISCEAVSRPDSLKKLKATIGFYIEIANQMGLAISNCSLVEELENVRYSDPTNSSLFIESDHNGYLN